MGLVKKVSSLNEVLKDYKIVARRPQKDDLVYIPSQDAIYKVLKVDRMNVVIEREHEGSGLIAKFPPSYYKLIEKK